MTDYCTLWPEGSWAHCCKAHDLAYAIGSGKLQADIDLGLCVAESGFPVMGSVMAIGTTIFGWVFYKRRKRNGLRRRDKNTG